MKTPEMILPTEHEITEFFEKMREILPDWKFRAPEDLPEQKKQESADIVLDNNSRNLGVVKAIYGQLE